MEKKKILIGIAIVLALAALAYFSLVEKNKRSTLNIKETEFSIQDTASIDKIFIASKYGWKSLLEKKNDREWILNGKYKVNRMQLGVLLKTLYWQRIKRPVHAGEREMVIKNIATKGLKVEVYQNGEKTKIFYVGGDANDSKGTYFIMEGSENPFVVYMPNHTGFLSPRYIVKEENYRHTRIFSSDLKSFREIKVEYTANPSEGFIIKNDDGKAGLVGMDKYNQVAVNNYVSGFSRIHLTRFVDDEEGIQTIDSLRNYSPGIIISVKDDDPAYSNSIRLYQYENDPDGMLGIANMEGDERYVVVQNYVFNKLIVPASSFKLAEDN
jgi:hypothetical protein